jgi:ribonuclease HI
MPTALSSAFEQESIASAMSDLEFDQLPSQCATPPPIAHPFLLRFDGSAKGNPGPAGSGSVLYHVIDGVVADIIWSDAYELLTSDTNNVAEYTGLIRGLQHCQREKLEHFDIEGDSLLVVEQVKLAMGGPGFAVNDRNLKK